MRAAPEMSWCVRVNARALGLVTTVGFVNAAPSTAAGQVVSGILMVSGLGVLTMATAAVASLFVSEAEEPERDREREFEEESFEQMRAIVGGITSIERRLDALERTRTGGESR